ncbi:MAG: threonine--tRNA ligase [Chloroflexia bacterium]
MNDLERMRHSAAHVLAEAVLELFPEAKLAIGPPIEDGFYYDFDLPRSLTPDDLAAIEVRMRGHIAADERFETEVFPTRAAALTFFEGQPYKEELIRDLPDGEEISLYRNGPFADLCRGPHVESTGQIGAFKLMNVAGAYWRGDERRPMLQRIYGTAWGSQAELDEHLHRLEEARKRDHRVLGRELDLFVFSDLVGKGLPLWTAKGAVIRRELERFIVEEEVRRGYQHVSTPDIGHLSLYETSGHYPYYKETMYAPITIDDEQFMLRPMTCPHHFALYKSRPHSYRELPLRIAELAKLYRYEKSGELSGLMRVRGFCLADAHIIATSEQAVPTINEALDLIEYAASVWGMVAGEHFRYRLSLGDRADSAKYYKDDAMWDFAEGVLRSVLHERQAPFYEGEGEAAFYGPKIDIQMRNIHGKEETAFTVQYDFVMPKRFDLRYIDAEGQEQEPIVIHRSSIGAIERIIAFLIEHFAGAFPVWLAPVQATLIPIADRHLPYVQEVAAKLKAAGLRVEIDDSGNRMQHKIRAAQVQKVPYMLVAGDRDVEAGAVSVRLRTEEQLGSISVDDFLALIKPIIATKSLDLQLPRNAEPLAAD